MKDKKIRQIEPIVKAPDSIRQGVQTTLSTYRVMGDIASLYLSDLSHTLLGFTDLVNPNKTPLTLEDNKENPIPPKKDLP